MLYSSILLLLLLHTVACRRLFWVRMAAENNKMNKFICEVVKRKMCDDVNGSQAVWHFVCECGVKRQRESLPVFQMFVHKIFFLARICAWKCVLMAWKFHWISLNLCIPPCHLIQFHFCCWFLFKLLVEQQTKYPTFRRKVTTPVQWRSSTDNRKKNLIIYRLMLIASDTTAHNGEHIK